MRTQRAKEHEAGEGGGPEVLRVDHVATIELGKELASDTRRVNAVPKEELTKRPSASQLHRVSIALGMTLSAVGEIATWYPHGPGGSTPLIPGNSRSSM